MSDMGRQSMTDKAGYVVFLAGGSSEKLAYWLYAYYRSALKPDSQKTTTEQAGDYVKGTSDSIASTLQPQGEKSTTQKAGDTLSGNSNENSESLLDKAKVRNACILNLTDRLADRSFPSYRTPLAWVATPPPPTTPKPFTPLSSPSCSAIDATFCHGQRLVAIISCIK